MRCARGRFTAHPLPARFPASPVPGAASLRSNAILILTLTLTFTLTLTLT